MGESISLPFPFYTSGLLSLTCDCFLYLQIQQWLIQSFPPCVTLTLRLSPASFVFKECTHSQCTVSTLALQDNLK